MKWKLGEICKALYKCESIFIYIKPQQDLNNIINHSLNICYVLSLLLGIGGEHVKSMKILVFYDFMLLFELLSLNTKGSPKKGNIFIEIIN